jgi:NADH-quinone oxidoreductase subunit N
MRWDAVAGLLFYLVVYAIATLGTFAALAYLGRSDEQINDVDELAGLAKAYPVTAAAMAVCLLSLTGVPPLAGFWGKLAVFAGVLEVDPAAGASISRTWFIVLAVVGVVNAAVAAAYYLRIVSVVYFRLPRAVLRAQGGSAARAVAFACALLTIGVGLSSGPLWRAAMDASRSVKVEAAHVEAPSGPVANPR